MEPFTHAEGGHVPGLLALSNWMKLYPGITAGFSMRHGGVSEGHFSTLNCGLHVPDEARSVVENRRRVAEAVGIPLASWVYGEQVHGHAVAVVAPGDQGKGTVSLDNALQATDGFITSERGICLAALFADCVPLYFFDPVLGVIGLAHAGWKGTVAEIAAQTIRQLCQNFGCRVENLAAAIGPSIQSCCYEVDDKVITKVKELELGHLSKDSLNVEKPLFTKEDSGKYMLDLQEVNRQIMIKEGILPSSIEVSQMCTSCRVDLFFSHRKERGQTGRMVAWIGMSK